MGHYQSFFMSSKPFEGKFSLPLNLNIRINDSES
uniref:Uncharacterized protein n=1 Tax=Rhizophora mucronata TaxID=61149 RepID=A0A2P2L892_RHIMU